MSVNMFSFVKVISFRSKRIGLSC